MKKIIIASTSTVYGESYLEYLLPTLKLFFKGINRITFIPFARPGGITYDDYTTKAKQAFATIGIDVVGIHEFKDQVEGVNKSEAFFTGGGNTFELVTQLYNHNLMEVLKNRVEDGAPYLGTSAGSNICGVSMMNTNDMPVVYPPSFTTMGLIPFNINAHFIEANPNSTHMGETRETRIKEFHIYNETPVLGLKEGSWLEVLDNKITLKGNLSAKWFEPNKPIKEIHPEYEF